MRIVFMALLLLVVVCVPLIVGYHLGKRKRPSSIAEQQLIVAIDLVNQAIDAQLMGSLGEAENFRLAAKKLMVSNEIKQLSK